MQPWVLTKLTPNQAMSSIKLANRDIIQFNLHEDCNVPWSALSEGSRIQLPHWIASIPKNMKLVSLTIKNRRKSSVTEQNMHAGIILSCEQEKYLESWSPDLFYNDEELNNKRQGNSYKSQKQQSKFAVSKSLSKEPSQIRCESQPIWGSINKHIPGVVAKPKGHETNSLKRQVGQDRVSKSVYSEGKVEESRKTLFISDFNAAPQLGESNHSNIESKNQLESIKKQSESNLKHRQAYSDFTFRKSISKQFDDYWDLDQEILWENVTANHTFWIESLNLNMEKWLSNKNERVVTELNHDLKKVNIQAISYFKSFLTNF